MNRKKTSWNLSPLFKSDYDPKIETNRKQVAKATNKFIIRWKNRNDYLINTKILKEALDEYEKWSRFIGANSQERYYFHLRTSRDQNDPKLKALENKAIEFSKKLENEMQFFELRIAKIDPKQQRKFLEYKPLQPYKHFLEKLFIQSKYHLSESEEKIMNLKSTPAHSNWVKMTQGFLTKEEAKVFDEDGKVKIKTFSDLLGLMKSKNKKTRDSAAKAFNFIQKKYVDVAEHEINSILMDKKINDNLRSFDRPDRSRHVGDDIETEIVDSLVKTVSNHFDIPKRYYKLKAKLLNVPKLAYHERNVEYGKIDKKYTYEAAVEILSKVFNNLNPEFGNIFKGFVEQGRIDVYPKKNKYSGAFCTYGLLIHPTYSLLNWTNKLNDVLTLAHEMGHGINFELVKAKENALNYGTTVATTEVASTFMEDFVLEELKKDADDELKLALSMMRLNEEISTIFRQVALYNFELDLHKELRVKGYLSEEEIGKLFRKHMVSYMGPYVEQSEGSENWWVSWSHIRYFFYVYSYASGLLISKSLQASVKTDPKFILKVKEFLSAGLSDSPKNIFSKLGIDITDNKFWEKGISEVEYLLLETESLAKKLGKI
ncbi:MAG: Oligoendopeptidase, pepF/M3 family [Microgenomates group bacterium GW2011_GWC1_37_8]|nr:MAG: Oligoendopeptidase, pepF/M3 family [Microgenomates group bacterium GW2011_GWC1_37_8]